MPQITVGEATFRKLMERARSQGFADLPSYLDDLAEDGFAMTPEIEAALEVGLEDIRQGRVVDESVIEEDVARMRREYLEKAA